MLAVCVARAFLPVLVSSAPVHPAGTLVLPGKKNQHRQECPCYTTEKTTAGAGAPAVAVVTNSGRSALLDVVYFAVDEDDLHAGVHVDPLRSDIGNVLGFTHDLFHFTDGHAE